MLMSHGVVLGRGPVASAQAAADRANATTSKANRARMRDM